jgi:hypothetical protein
MVFGGNKTKKIVVVVEGGVVQDVAWSPELDVAEWELIDFDNMEAEGLSSEERDAKLKEAMDSL